jgi:hypothetical protein
MQTSRKPLSRLLCALMVPCLVTPSLASIYPIIEGFFRWDMLSGFMLINIGLTIGTVTLAKVCEMYNWKIFIATYCYMLILFACNLLLANFALPHGDPNSLASIAIQAFVNAGLVEESFKLICWLPWVAVGRKQDEENFLVWIAALSGLYFGVFENFNMVVILGTVSFDGRDLFVTAFAESIFMAVAYIRFIWGPLIHISLAVIGHSIFTMLKKRRGVFIAYIWVLIIPAALHGLYDFVIYNSNHTEGAEWCIHLAPSIAMIIILVSLGLVIRAGY